MHTLSDYDYTLPHHRIATHPALPRDAAKMLVWHEGQITHETFQDLPKHLKAGDVLVVNSSKVIPARLFASRPRADGDGEMSFEILLHRPLGQANAWECFIKNSKRLKVGHTLSLEEGITAEVTAKNIEKGTVNIAFNLKQEAVFDFFERVGDMPLPPYIDRPDGAEAADSEEYQTVYAKEKGSVAAPTAGLHFTDELIQTLEEMGVHIVDVTLHVGAGTFQPVQVEDIQTHVMHAEWGRVGAETVDVINKAKANGGRIIAVGTTSTRLLETAARSGRLQPWQGDTDIFMTPGFDFYVVDGLITNFHLPKSTLMMLVAAFVGFEEMHSIYKTAIESDYRFYSYGDGSLLWRK